MRVGALLESLEPLERSCPLIDQNLPTAELLGNINHFVVLMLENRSFDHLLGSLRAQNPAVVGALDNEYSNPAAYAMPFDPGHEFEDVQIQLYGEAPGSVRAAGPRINPAPMTGFAYSALSAAKDPSQAALVMQCFQPPQLPVLMSLANEFAVFNYWHSSLPGPTWPNRFFVHAATSGGLTDSPQDASVLAGFTFPGQTIYQRLEAAGKSWHIYHDGLPQTAGIDHLRLEFLDVFTQKFREMDCFESDLRLDTLPEYMFIEPRYDTGHQSVNGNSMHPLNDVRKGELLIKRVYEAIRVSRYWADTMLVITCDEHGGFFDHVPPPSAVPPGGDQRYADPANHFDFDLLGVRVPAIVVSAYTGEKTVIGATPQESFDHTSILKTVEKRFGLPWMSERDKAASTLEAALNVSAPRMSADEAPMTLPAPIADSLVTKFLHLFRESTIDAAAPLTPGQRVQLALAHACNMQILDPAAKLDAHQRFLAVRGLKDAADYIEEAENRIRARRRA